MTYRQEHGAGFGRGASLGLRAVAARHSDTEVVEHLVVEGEIVDDQRDVGERLDQIGAN
jgi:hypothetical protein